MCLLRVLHAQFISFPVPSARDAVSSFFATPLAVFFSRHSKMLGSPEGIAKLADNPGIVAGAYVSAFLPWAVLYAFDFISAKWKSIKRTRRAGHFHLTVSLPPVAYIVFYVHLQRISGDFKEMWAAITAAVLCLFNVIRSFWGLMQLHAFLKWSNRALQTLNRMGYHQDKAKGRTEKIIDEEMLVNSTLIDNEFGDTDLPVALAFHTNWKKNPWPSIKSMAISIGAGRIEELLYCNRPSECCTRWLAAFLCKFGAEWLKDCKVGTSQFDLSRGDRFSTNMAVKGFLQVTVSSENSHRKTDLYSIVSPTHLVSLYMCSGRVFHQLSKEVFPYSYRRKYEYDEAAQYLRLERFSPTLRHSIASWDPKDLNKLNDDERSAVESMNAIQLETFLTLMNEGAGHWEKYENGKERTPFVEELTDESIPVAVLLDQLGFSSQNTIKDVIRGLPIKEEFCKPLLWDSETNKSILQASAHIDNTVSLRFGSELKRWRELGNNLYSRRNEEHFEAQQRLSVQILQGMLACQSQKSEELTVPSARFIGCISETVRSLLGEWLVRTSRTGAKCNWNPNIHINDIPFTFTCSEQLAKTLLKMKMEFSKEDNSPDFDERLEGVHLRILWECQYFLQRQAAKEMEESGHTTELGSSTSLIMLFILGFPALSISYKNRSNAERQSMNERDHISELDEELGESIVDQGDRENCIELTIEPMCAPEKIILRLICCMITKKCRIEYDSNIFGNAQNSTRCFSWQDWKDSVMGRISGQSIWLKTRHDKKTDWFRERAGKSSILNPMLNISHIYTQLDHKIMYWSGWPPFYPKIARFEVLHSEKILPNHLYAETNHYMAAVDSELQEALFRLEDGLKVVEQFESSQGYKVLVAHQKIAVENEACSQTNLNSAIYMNPDEILRFPDWTMLIRDGNQLEEYLSVKKSIERDDVEYSLRLLRRIYRQKHKISYLKQLVDHFLHPVVTEQRHLRQLVMDMKVTLFLIYLEAQHDMDDEKVEQISLDRKELANCALKVSERTGDEEAHLLYCQALFHEATPVHISCNNSKKRNEVPEKAIYAFENLLSKHDQNKQESNHLHLYLAASFLNNFYAQKNEVDKLLGIQHLERVKCHNSSNPHMKVLLEGRSMEGELDAIFIKAEEDIRDPLLVRMIREILMKAAPNDAERATSSGFYKDFGGVNECDTNENLMITVKQRELRNCYSNHGCGTNALCACLKAYPVERKRDENSSFT